MDTEQTPPKPPRFLASRFLWSFCLFFIAFAGLWGGIVYWEMGGFRSVDVLLAARMNSLVGTSSAMDLTLIFLVERSGDYAIAVFTAILALYVVRQALGRRANPGVVLAYSVYIGFVLTMTFGFVEAVDHSVWRSSPQTILLEYRDPGDSYNIEYEAKTKSSFPSRRVALTSAVFFLLWFRFGRRALPTLVSPLLTGSLHIAAGQSWPSDALGGLITGWMMASCAYFLSLNRVHLLLESTLERAYDEGLSRRTFRAFGRWAKSRSRDTRMGRWDERATHKRRGCTLPDELRELLLREWPAEKTEVLGTGHKKKLFPVSLDGKPCALKVSRLGADRLSALEGALTLVESCVAQSALRAPAIVRTHSGARTVPWGNHNVYLMEWIQGITSNISDPDQCTKIVRLLASFHKHAGTPPEQSTPYAREVLQSEIEKMQADLETCRRAARSLNRWFIPHSAEADSYASLVEDLHRARSVVHMAMLYHTSETSPGDACYIHGDTHPMNYLFDGSEEPWFVDFDTIRPGYAFEDLEMPLSKCLRRHGWDPQLFESLISEYLSIRKLGNWEVLVLLGRLACPRNLTTVFGDNPLGALLPKRNRWIRLLKENVEYSMTRGAREAFVHAIASRYQIPSLASSPWRSSDTPSAAAASSSASQRDRFTSDA